jgi:aminoglycoside phosphotransferase (APT) family kinase protein
VPVAPVGPQDSELHAVDPTPVDVPVEAADPREWLADLTGLAELRVVDPIPVEAADPREWLPDLTGLAELLRVLHADPPPMSSERVLAHADLGAEHLLAAKGRLTGVIDWSDAAVTDPALDFARLHRDFGPTFLDEALRAYGSDSPAFRRRITFFARCAALEDLAYGHPDYTRAATRSLAWLFPG